MNVSFLRNMNHYPDSGRTHAALHGAADDPERTVKPTSVSENFTAQNGDLRHLIPKTSKADLEFVLCVSLEATHSGSLGSSR